MQPGMVRKGHKHPCNVHSDVVRKAIRTVPTGSLDPPVDSMDVDCLSCLPPIKPAWDSKFKNAHNFPHQTGKTASILYAGAR